MQEKKEVVVKCDCEAKTESRMWADATPAGLVALAVACLCYFALLTGLIEGERSYLFMGGWLLGGFLIQFIVAMIDLKNKNFGGGNTFLYFSGFFMLNGAIARFIQGGAIGGGYVELSPLINGFAWIALAIAFLLWTPIFFKSAGQLFLLVLVLNVAFPFMILRNFGVGIESGAFEVFGWISGICLVVCAFLGLWLASATIVNKAFGRQIYPTLKPFYKEKKK
ncbi:MAG: GPR1/FUN34/YaaH family transporter [Firmicutes bacterium]|nr:GPR1/FUN34/YaaH family transporter [Bacillota bacterium]